MKLNFMQELYLKNLMLTCLYGIFFTFCIYENFQGITFPILMIGSIYFFSYFLKKAGKAKSKYLYFLEISMILLSISSVLSADTNMMVLNVLVMMLLMLIYLLFFAYEVTDWDIPHCISQIVRIVFGTLGSYLKPFTDFFVQKSETLENLESEKKEKKNQVQFVLIGLLISIPLVFFIIVLLSSADLVFRDFLYQLTKDISFSDDLMGWLFYFFFGFLSVYGVLSFLTSETKVMEKKKRNQGETLIALTFTSILAFVYGLFSIIQVIYLFLGKGNLPDGFTYAEYAREGFFQLVFVCMINVGLVLFCMHYYRSEKSLNIILSMINIFTYCLIFSSLYRMLLYIQVYSLTFLRVFVIWALILIFCTITLLLISIWKRNFPLLKVQIVVATSLYLVLSLMKPDYIIAVYQCGQLSDNQEISVDTYYITNLSADAAHVIYDHQKQIVESFQKTEQFIVESDLEAYFNRMKSEASELNLRTWNLSRYLAGSLVKEN